MCFDELILPQLTLPQGWLLLILRTLRALLLCGPPGVDGRPAARSGGRRPAAAAVAWRLFLLLSFCPMCTALVLLAFCWR
jgi:hypothetical protein